MSVRLFIGYFLALTACATVAFASSFVDHAAALDTPAADSQPQSPRSAPAHRHSRQNLLKHLLLAEVR